MMIFWMLGNVQITKRRKFSKETLKLQNIRLAKWFTCWRNYVFSESFISHYLCYLIFPFSCKLRDLPNGQVLHASCNGNLTRDLSSREQLSKLASAAPHFVLPLSLYTLQRGKWTYQFREVRAGIKTETTQPKSLNLNDSFTYASQHFPKWRNW